MKLLMLNAYFNPEQIAFTHLENDLLEAFTNEGFFIDVVTPIPTRGVDKSTIKQYAKIQEEVLYNGLLKVHRFWAPQEKKNPIVRAFRYFWCNLREYQIGKRYLKSDVILSGSTPPTQGFIAAKVKKYIQKNGNHDVAFIYNLQDIFPDSLVTAGMAKRGSLLWKVGRLIEDYSYNNADKIITISEDFKNNIMQKGVPLSNIAVIPNWIDSSVVFPVSREQNNIISRYKLNPKKFYVCYSGNIGHSQNLELLLEVAKDIQERTSDIEFVIIGEGVAKDELFNRIEDEKILNIHLLPFQPYDEISHVFSLGDVGLIISKPGVGRSSVPSKTWGIMAASRAVIASYDRDSELCLMIEKADCGIVVDADDKEGLVTAINSLYIDRKYRDKLGLNGRSFIIDYLDKNICVSKYVEVIKRKHE